MTNSFLRWCQALTQKCSVRTLIYSAVIFLLSVNILIFAKVSFNRSQVVSTIVLSERELGLPYAYKRAQHNSGVQLLLNWSTPQDFTKDQWQWYNKRDLTLSKEHFESFSFRACKNGRYTSNEQVGWVLLEFNGLAYNDYLAAAQTYHKKVYSAESESKTQVEQDKSRALKTEADDTLKRVKESVSRLFIIAAAADKSLLLNSLKERRALTSAPLFIAPAKIQPGYYRCDTEDKLPYDVVIQDLMVTSIHVPKHLAQSLVGAEGVANNNLHFLAKLNYGRQYEPWLTQIERCNPSCTSNITGKSSN